MNTNIRRKVSKYSCGRCKQQQLLEAMKQQEHSFNADESENPFNHFANTLVLSEE